MRKFLMLKTPHLIHDSRCCVKIDFMLIYFECMHMYKCTGKGTMVWHTSHFSCPVSSGENSGPRAS